MTTLTFPQIEALWNANGGNPNLAPVMAAIAEAESGGNTASLNNNPSTGDYSVGLWQINYYDGLLGPRTQRYGSPSDLQNDPNAQARAAKDLAGPNGEGLGANWTTYGGQRFRDALQANGGAVPDANYVSALAGGGTVTGSDPRSLPNPCLINTPGSLPCLLNQAQLRALVGGISLVGGGVVVLAGLAVILAGAGLANKQVSALANLTPVGRVANGVRSAASGMSGGSRPTSPASVEELDEDLSLQRRAAEAEGTASRAPRTSAGGRRMVGRKVAA